MTPIAVTPLLAASSSPSRSASRAEVQIEGLRDCLFGGVGGGWGGGVVVVARLLRPAK